MSRPPIKKRVCEAPVGLKFGLKGVGPKPIKEMSIEQLEVIRLIDYMSLTQEEAAKNMGIARTSVQKLYHEARVKIAKSIFEENDIVVRGGKYAVHQCDYCTPKEGENLVKKVAIITDNDQVSMHFGRSNTYHVITITKGEVTHTEAIALKDSQCSNPEALLKLKLDAIIVGGMGEKPFERFKDHAIKVYHGEGEIEDVIERFINDALDLIEPHSHNHHQ